MMDEQQLRRAIRKTLPGAQRSLSKAGGAKYARRHMESRTIEWLVDAAREGDDIALAILRERAREARGTGAAMPGSLHEFVREFFIDGPPKKAPGPRLYDHVLRDGIVASWVKIAVEEGFREYRSKASHDTRTPPFSACAIVAQELGLSESAVEAIWRARKPKPEQPRGG